MAPADLNAMLIQRIEDAHLRRLTSTLATDAKRLCASVLGDDEKRHACMQEHRSELSKDCLHAIAESRQH